jgi:hypothetical protein
MCGHYGQGYTQNSTHIIQWLPKCSIYETTNNHKKFGNWTQPRFVTPYLLNFCNNKSKSGEHEGQMIIKIKICFHRDELRRWGLGKGSKKALRFPALRASVILANLLINFASFFSLALHQFLVIFLHFPLVPLFVPTALVEQTSWRIISVLILFTVRKKKKPRTLFSHLHCLAWNKCE